MTTVRMVDGYTIRPKDIVYSVEESILCTALIDHSDIRCYRIANHQGEHGWRSYRNKQNTRIALFHKAPDYCNVD